MTTLITSATRIDANGTVRDFWLLLDGGVIVATGVGAGGVGAADAGAGGVRAGGVRAGGVRAAVAAAAETAGLPRLHDVTEIVDAHGAVVTPGLIDLHSHGGGGHSFDWQGDDTAAEIDAALAMHRSHGTTRSLISLVAAPLDELELALALVHDLAEADPLVLGAHLEGPFLEHDHRGAHEAALLLDPTPARVDRLLAAADGTLRLVTIAPELPGSLAAIDRLRAAGVVVAVGHTGADHDLARQAFDRGATVLTHAFNAMPGIHHRAPGPVVAAIGDPRVTLEVILDGVHVHPTVARLLFDAAPDRVALITDAMAAAGAADGEYRLGGLDVTVSGGVARLQTSASDTTGASSGGPGPIAGSTLTQDAALRIAIAADIPVRDAITALTFTPARALGLETAFGLLEPGRAADVVLWGDDWRPTHIWAAGSAVRPAP